MIKKESLKKGIPISLALAPALENENIDQPVFENKKRLLTISLLAVTIAICISFVARLLVSLIDLFTNISFYGKFSFVHTSPSGNSLGLLVILIPVIGGIIVGFMALYGSKAIRGHGIPEAMEQILTNQSKIKPTITYLKPLSSAIAIGTGGPFGAEGPIIATGGALGSTFGQLIRISNNERKILLAAGATAGMSAIFGSPVAAIFLAIELLLFEFSPRSIIPVALACITGAAGHYYLFGHEPVFSFPQKIEPASDTALAVYSFIGILIGLISILITKVVYFIEDCFEKLPIHWMWWPAMGGIAVGVIGFFAPRTLGVGYENIANILSGSLPVKVILFLCFLKFISWAIALGSGTSGGTLAPLLTIGGATGALLAIVITHFFPGCGISLSLAALIGMSAMFAGASRALLTSIVFAIETTSQSNALLPLLASCTGSYFVSFLLMENTIMTEKIARRGIKTPHSFEPDILESITADQVLNDNGLVLNEENTVAEVMQWLEKDTDHLSNHYIVINNNNEFKGILNSSVLFNPVQKDDIAIGLLLNKKNVSVSPQSSLRYTVEMMAKENVDVLPVITADNDVTGIISYKDILPVYRFNKDEYERRYKNISIKRKGLKVLLHGQKIIRAIQKKNNP